MKYTELKQIVNKSLINPKDKNLSVTVRLIIEANNPDYWLQRAIELLREVQLNINRGYGDTTQPKYYEENLCLATTLLTLCRYKNNEKVTGRNKTRDQTTEETDNVSKGT